MIFKEYYRLIKSKFTMLIIVVLSGLSLVDFMMMHSEKMMFIEQFNTSTSPDLNKVALEALIAKYTGIRFLFNFWFNSDFSQFLSSCCMQSVIAPELLMVRIPVSLSKL